MKKVEFQKLSIQNFLSIGKELTIDFKDGITLITGENKDKNNDRNGVGKSSIISGFYFALFGTTIRDIKKEEIVNNLAKKQAVVKLEFLITDNGVSTSYRIERGVAPSFCKLFVGGDVDKTLSTIPATNNYILSLINTSASLFRNTVTMSLNSNTPFMKQKKNEKRDFVEGIFKLEVIKLMAKITKENYDTIAQEYNVLTGKFEDNLNTVRQFTDKEASFEQNRQEKILTLSKREVEQEKNIFDLNAGIVVVDQKQFEQSAIDIRAQQTILSEKKSNYKQGLDLISRAYSLVLTTQQKYDQLNSSIKALLTQCPNFATYEESDTFKNATAGIEDCKQSIETHKGSILTNTHEISIAKKLITQLETVGDVCDKCLRPYEQTDQNARKDKIAKNVELIKTLSERISESNAAISDCNTKIATMSQQIKEAEMVLRIRGDKEQLSLIGDELKKLTAAHATAQKTVNQDDTAITTLEKEIEIAKSVYNILKASIDRNTTIQTMVASLQKSIENTRNDIVAIKNEINAFTGLIQETTNKNVKLELEIEESKKMISIYNVIKNIVSDDGFKTHIVQKMLTVLNERINYYLEKLDANCTMTFNEYFEDSLINDRGTPCSYDSFSGGEQRRIDLACLFAFMDIRRIQGEVSFNINFFDEILDSALSSDGSQKLFEILDDRSKNSQEHSYIITHKQENLKNPLVTDVIYLEKIGGVTRIKEKTI